MSKVPANPTLDKGLNLGKQLSLSGYKRTHLAPSWLPTSQTSLPPVAPLQSRHLGGQWGKMGLLLASQAARLQEPQPVHTLGRRHPRIMPTRARLKVKNQSLKELFCLRDPKSTSCLHWCHVGPRAVSTEIGSSDLVACV